MTDFDRQTECPHCGAVFSVPRIRVGRQEQCPVCRARFTVPEVGAASAGPARGALEAEEVLEPAPEANTGQAEGFEPLVRPQDGSERVVVCCAREEKINPIAVAPLISSFTGIARRDALMQVTRGMGVLAEGLSADAARNMLAALAEEGVEAFIVPESAAPPAELKVEVTRIDRADEKALFVQTDLRGTVRPVAWTAVVTGICTRARFGKRTASRRRDSHAFLPTATFGPAISRPPRWTAGRVETPAIRVTLVLRASERKLARLDFLDNQVRYGYLGERAAVSRTQNLALLVADVLRWSEDAFFPASAWALADGKERQLARVIGKRDYGNYLRWAICCAAARGLLGRP